MKLLLLLLLRLLLPNRRCCLPNIRNLPPRRSRRCLKLSWDLSNDSSATLFRILFSNFIFLDNDKIHTNILIDIGVFKTRLNA
jgi:hypothetical protein